MNSWKPLFDELNEKEYFKELSQFLDSEYSSFTVYPPRELMFNAFNRCQLDNLKVVIIGQDPYHEPGQAMGMAFSVPTGITLPPSLINIYKEIEKEYGYQMRKDGDLSYLAEQGILMLNAYLSVRKGEPLSHKCSNYEKLIKDVLLFINKQDTPVVYLLWGGFAQKYAKYLTNPNHLVLKANHPSPLSANRGGWFGNNHFKLTNEFLVSNNKKPIDWKN